VDEKIRTDKYETILEMWEEGWVYNDYGDVIDEIRGLHTGEKPLWQWSDDEIDAEYENAVAWKEEQE
tara:strand:- start:74 stop:274 length:201 start_codon:yes stop_codon:yes gene_type:complete